MEAAKAQFFTSMEKIVEDAQSGEVSHAAVAEEFALLDSVTDIVPSDTNQIRAVYFSGRNAKPIEIHENTGLWIREARRVALIRVIEITGIVVEVNAHSFTF